MPSGRDHCMLSDAGDGCLRVAQAEDRAPLGEIELAISAGHGATPSGKYLKKPTELHFAVEITGA